jgi:hypothetical protein
MLEEISGKLGSMKCLRVLSQSGGDAAAPPVLAADLEVPSSPLLRIRIRRIHMFLGLPDPDPLDRGTDSDPSIIKQKLVRKPFDSYCFVTFFYFLSLIKDVNVPSNSNKQKKLFNFFCCRLVGQ